MHDTKDSYLWRAILSEDGTDILDEEDADGTPHTYAEIDQERLRAFVLLPNREGLASHAVFLEPGQRLIFFRRTRIDNAGPLAGISRKAHVVGHQETIKGQNVKSMLAVFDDGTTFLVSDEALIEP